MPLGAKDGFQGWTNQFWNDGLGNIEGGIIDQYAGLGYSWDKNSDLLFTHHIFDADETELSAMPALNARALRVSDVPSVRAVPVYAGELATGSVPSSV